MRKVILFMMVSLDGYFEGPNHDISWHNADNDEFADFAHGQNAEFDTILFGKTTYQMMADFWPTDQAVQIDPGTTKFMNATPKVFFAHQQMPVAWENTRLVTENSSEEVKKLKTQTGKAIAIFGSNNFMTSLIPDNLVDEFRVMVNPLALGAGTALFKGIDKKLDLELITTRQFNSGNILLTYKQRS